MSYVLAKSSWIGLQGCLGAEGVTYEYNYEETSGFMFVTGNPEGRAKYHIHGFQKTEAETVTFTGLLAKSSNWRGGEEPDLAAYPMDEWVGLCSGMDSSTLAVVRALKACFERLGAIFHR